MNTRPECKYRRVLRFLASGRSLHRFLAEQAVHDHTLNSTGEIRRRLGGIDHSTLWRWIRRGEFPPPDIKIGPRLNGWYESTFDEYIKRKECAA